MKKISTGQKRLVAEYFTNIGVAWFAAGVIGVFISGIRNSFEILISVAWGLLFSILFLYAGIYLTRGLNHDF